MWKVIVWLLLFGSAAAKQISSEVSKKESFASTEMPTQ